MGVPEMRQLPLLVSVVLPTYRRVALLGRCLHALMRQDLPSACYEVLVVDDGQEEAAQLLVQQLAVLPGAPALRYLRPEQGRGPAAARNCGWRAARAPLVAFTDDDTVADPQWLRQGLQGMRAPWLALAGQVRVPALYEPGRRPTDHELMTQGLEHAEFVTANAFVWRAALILVGGFDERFQRPWREDTDLQFRLEALGPVGRCDAALVWHPVRPERWGVALRQQRNVFFDALLYRKHPRLYRVRLRRRPPWDYYLIVLLSLLVLVLFLGGWPAQALLCGAAALALVLALAWRRLRPTARHPAHVCEVLLTSALIPFLSVYWRLRGALHFRVFFL
ncbi:glycosyltransferase family 2 protein [Roseateles sp. DB2]|uniref:glycosyltransferase family 2 protein n=1 Tax=Roseateles sp. DB2 TaxID=3453717 RepID=UPI003EEB95B0